MCSNAPPETSGTQVTVHAIDGRDLPEFIKNCDKGPNCGVCNKIISAASMLSDGNDQGAKRELESLLSSSSQPVAKERAIPKEKAKAIPKEKPKEKPKTTANGVKKYIPSKDLDEALTRIQDFGEKVRQDAIRFNKWVENGRNVGLFDKPATKFIADLRENILNALGDIISWSTSHKFYTYLLLFVGSTFNQIEYILELQTFTLAENQKKALEYSHLYDDYNKLADDYDLAYKTNQGLQIKYEKAQDQASRNFADLDEAQTKCKKLEAELKELRSNVAKSEANAKKLKDAKKPKDIKDTPEQLELKSTIDKLKDDNQKAMDTINRQLVNIRHLEQEVLSGKKTRSNLDQKITQLQKELATANTSRRNIEAERQQFKGQYLEFERKSSTLESEIAELKTALSNADVSRIDKLNATIADYKAQIRALETAKDDKAVLEMLHSIWTSPPHPVKNSTVSIETQTEEPRFVYRPVMQSAVQTTVYGGAHSMYPHQSKQLSSNSKPFIPSNVRPNVHKKAPFRPPVYSPMMSRNAYVAVPILPPGIPVPSADVSAQMRDLLRQLEESQKQLGK